MIRTSQDQKEWYQIVWFPYATLKYTLVYWLACQNKLSTGDRISSWDANAKTDCGAQVESRNHIFFLCPFSSQVWETLMTKFLLVDFSSEWEQVLKLFSNTSYDKIKLFLLLYAFQATVYHIRRERNQRHHGEVSLSLTRLVKLINKNVQNQTSSIRITWDIAYKDAMV